MLMEYVTLWLLFTSHFRLIYSDIAFLFYCTALTILCSTHVCMHVCSMHVEYKKPVAPVAQRYLVTLRHVGTLVRPRQTGFFSLKTKKQK